MRSRENDVPNQCMKCGTNEKCSCFNKYATTGLQSKDLGQYPYVTNWNFSWQHGRKSYIPEDCKNFVLDSDLKSERGISGQGVIKLA